jgi:hypothetical protein
MSERQRTRHPPLADGLARTVAAFQATAKRK